MLAATAELALEGGWDAVQMREVAQRADVALGTLYRYFPSKEFLLVSVMISEIEGLADRLAVRPPQGDDPVERVVDVLHRANRALQRQPQVTLAMIRALISGNQDIAPAVRETRSLMRRIISDALGTEPAEPDDPTDRSVLTIDLLSDVWLAALVSWITGVEPASSLAPKLSDATRVLLG
jgi:TetR/AcrR family transcriptional regulator, cholesterol catabolism regulator